MTHTSDALSKAGTSVSGRTASKLLATQGYVVGVEISGSGARLSAALADLNGNILHRVRRPLESVPDAQAISQLLGGMISDVTNPERLSNGRILRVGVAVGGLVDVTQGVVRTLYHAHGWDNFPLQDYFTEKLDVPCIIDNNANAAALAEVKQGVGTGERGVLYVGLGQGIGGALLVNGQIYHGTTCTAGEIGHILVKENGQRCSCGGSGHLETVVSARAIVSQMLGLAVEYPETMDAIYRVTGNRAERLTAAQVFHLAQEGDTIASHVVEEGLKYLAIALANIVLLVNPGMIILGGPLAQAGELLINPLQTRVQELCLPVASQSLRIVQGSLGSEANLIGAVTLALQDL